MTGVESNATKRVIPIRRGVVGVGMTPEIAWNLAVGIVFAVGGGLLAFNFAHIRDRYTTFLNRPNVPRAWRRTRMNDPQYATAFGFLFLCGGVLISGVALLTVMGVRR